MCPQINFLLIYEPKKENKNFTVSFFYDSKYKKRIFLLRFR